MTKLQCLVLVKTAAAAGRVLLKLRSIISSLQRKENPFYIGNPDIGFPKPSSINEAL